MNSDSWVKGLDAVREFVVRIETPDSYGTGFLIARALIAQHKRPAIATACHVIEHASNWFHVIKIIHYASGKQAVLQPSDIVFAIRKDRDLALIHCAEGCLPLPEVSPVLGASKRSLSPGTPIGWCGFPNIARDKLCFFTGHVSASANTEGDYFVDGVVIHGVSGAPAFVLSEAKPVIVGLATGYFPNLAIGDPLPGMGFIRSINSYIDLFEATGSRGLPPRAAPADGQVGEA
jgi:hypothetical protein